MSKIIVLNGCSSSGKSTLAVKLQQRLPEFYQHVSLDQIRDGMPARTRGLNAPEGSEGAAGLNVVPRNDSGKPLTYIEFGEFGDRALLGMRKLVAAYSEMSVNVIVDDLLLKRVYLNEYATLLDPSQCWFIGVYCDLEEINRREAERIGRFPGTAESHFDLVHDHGLEYDLAVDTTVVSSEDTVQQIIERLSHPPRALAALIQSQAPT